jgi:mono/diheme cytochrome c family protein
MSSHTRRVWVWALVLISFMLLLVGCRAPTGTYQPFDWAFEMHYGQAYRSQEPPRLYSPEGVVPFKFSSDTRSYTREVAASLEEYAAFSNPLDRTTVTLGQGQEIFRVNCSFCHGSEALGPDTGSVGEKLLAQPPNLTTGAPSHRSSGQLFGLVSLGGTTQTRFGMPRFRSLLTEKQRWLVVDYLLCRQGRDSQGEAALCAQVGS